MDQSEKDALLEEARRKYPKGTVFNCAFNLNCSESIVTQDLHWQGIGISHPGILWVYFCGKWAKIVSKLEVEV